MLGLFPKMTVIHTGKHVEGQVYLPEINYILMCLCIAVSVGFQSTDHLGDAYGASGVNCAAVGWCLVHCYWYCLSIHFVDMTR